MKEGWVPLCAFLGVPAPEGEPFPHVNDAEEFRSRIAGARVEVLEGAGHLPHIEASERAAEAVTRFLA